ncbi:hypothetical protein [Corynebacterium flavescens]|nr:hypothetical protein [Corynebacterium flavescens]KAA8720000.1 hypothetical protein F4V60_10535 [Corynebacterium flavescens]MDN6227155.1 hypothetical protein [Corynebacterium flavescens]
MHKRYWAAGVVVLLTLVLVGALVVVPRSLESASDPGVVDSDGDGIADETEVAGWIGARGERFITDASNSDTDGDGLSDGEEAGERLPDQGTSVVYSGVADPLKADSDGDGLNDFLELRGWSDEQGRRYNSSPLKVDTDEDGLDDSIEIGRTVSGGIYAVVSNPQERDSDDDGLDDRVEVNGWKSVRAGKLFYTDPLLSDTDGDLLFDGEEAASSLEDSDAQPNAKPAYYGFSDPTVVDSDGDGLTDLDEFNSGAKPYEVDTDGDGLEDGREVTVIGTSPFLVDTDADGRDDKFEEENRESEGLDPLFFEHSLDAGEYVKSFWSGADGKDGGEEVTSTMGQLSSLVLSNGSLIFKAREIIEGIIDLVLRRSGRNLLSVFFPLTPVGIAKKIIKAGFNLKEYLEKLEAFIKQHPELRAVAGRFVSTSGMIPEDSRIAVSGKVWKSWDDYLKEGASGEGMLHLQSSGRIDLDALGVAMEQEAHHSGEASAFLADRESAKKRLIGDVIESREKSWWRSVKKFFGAISGTTWGQLSGEDLDKARAKIEAGVRVSSAACGEECANSRRAADVLADGVLYEANVGYVGLNDAVKARIDTDAALIAAGGIEGSHWHFYPSVHSGQLGGSPEMFDYLTEHGIRYTIHVPVE